MSTQKWTLTLCLAWCGWQIGSSSANGALTRPALTLTANPSNVMADYVIGDGGHMLYFNVNPAGTLTPVTVTVGGGFAFYSVLDLTVFDVNYGQSNRGFAGVGSTNSSISTPFNVPFYLGYYVQSGNPSSTIQANTSDGYGWAELLRGTNGLNLVDSALQYPSGGIIVGTTTAVPEPTTFRRADLRRGSPVRALSASDTFTHPYPITP